MDTRQARGSGYRFGLACVRAREAGSQKRPEKVLLTVCTAARLRRPRCTGMPGSTLGKADRLSASSSVGAGSAPVERAAPVSASLHVSGYRPRLWCDLTPLLRRVGIGHEAEGIHLQ